MALGAMTKAKLEENVALSRKHVAKQEAIIARLAEQGHHVSVATAIGVLETMHAHLALEVEMLAEMKPD